MAIAPTGIFGTDVSLQRAIFSALPLFGLFMTVQNYIDQQAEVNSFPNVRNFNGDEAIQQSLTLTDRALRYLKNWEVYLVSGIISDALTFVAISIAFSATGIFAGPIVFFSLQLLCGAGMLLRSICLLGTWLDLSAVEQRHQAGYANGESRLVSFSDAFPSSTRAWGTLH